MNIKVNGQACESAGARTLRGLLDELGYADPFIAVAVNGVCVVRRALAETELREGDEVEVLAPMAGG